MKRLEMFNRTRLLKTLIFLGVLLFCSIRNTRSTVYYFPIAFIFSVVICFFESILIKFNIQKAILNSYYVISLFGIGVYSLMKSEGLLSYSATLQTMQYIFSVVAALCITKMIYVLLANVDKVVGRRLLQIINLILFLMLLVLGKRLNGTIIGINVFGTTVQITELIKIVVVLYNSLIYTTDEYSYGRKAAYIGLFTLINGIFFIWMKELGTFMILYVLHFVYITLLSKNSKMAKCYLIASISLLVLIILFFSSIYPYMSIHTGLLEKIYHRFNVFMDLSMADPLNEGYQATQAKKALLLGGLIGSNACVEIPVATSDFVFSYIILRFGLITGLVLLLVYCNLFKNSIHNCYEIVGLRQGVGYGAAILIYIQVVYNIGMCVGILPICGISLCFMSHGFMSLLTSTVLMLLTLNLDI